MLKTFIVPVFVIVRSTDQEEAATQTRMGLEQFSSGFQIRMPMEIEGATTDTTAKEIFEQLAIEEQKTMAITWSVDDILWKAKDDGKIITEDQAKEVLQLLDKSHDASNGINWDTISETIRIVVKNNYQPVPDEDDADDNGVQTHLIEERLGIIDLMMRPFMNEEDSDITGLG